MGNEEGDYDDEYDSEFDVHDDLGYAEYYEATKKGKTAGEPTPEGPKSPRDRGKKARKPGDIGSDSEEDLDSDDPGPTIKETAKPKKKKKVEPDDSPAPGGSDDEDFSAIRKTGAKAARNKSGKLQEEEEKKIKMEEKRLKKQKKEDEAREKRIAKDEAERAKRDSEDKERQRINAEKETKQLDMLESLAAQMR